MCTTTNCFMPPTEPPTDSLKWLGRLLLTVAAGILLSQFGMRLSDDLKL